MKDNSATKLCKHCKSEMKKGAKVCLTCGKRQHMSIGCLAVIVILVIIGIIIASCGKAADDAVKEDEKKSNDKNVTAEAVIYDESGLKVTYTGMEAAALNVSTDIKLKIENNTDKSLVITIDDFSVDGYSINAPFYAEVAAGKITNDTIDVLDSYLSDNGLSYATIKEAEFKLNITDSNNITDRKTTDTIKFSLR